MVGVLVTAMKSLGRIPALLLALLAFLILIILGEFLFSWYVVRKRTLEIKQRGSHATNRREGPLS